MFTSLIERIIVGALLLAVVIAVPFGGWNWWRKNVYHEALQMAATSNVTSVRATEDTLRDEMRERERKLTQEGSERERILQEQLVEAGKPPAERVVYKLRDRWLPVSCPAGASGAAGEVAVGGLHPEDEQFFVRLAAEADDVVDERNLAIDAYNAHRQAVIDHNAKVRKR